MHRYDSLINGSDDNLISAIKEIENVDGIGFIRVVTFEHDESAKAGNFAQKAEKSELVFLPDEIFDSLEGYKAKILDRLKKNIPITETSGFLGGLIPEIKGDKEKSIVFLPVSADNVLWGFILCIHKYDFEWKASDISSFMEIMHRINAAVSRRNEILALLKERLSYSIIVESVNDIVARIDEMGIIRDIHGYFLRMSGYSRNDVIGKPLADLIYFKDRIKFEDEFRLISKARKSTEVRVNLKTGEPRSMVLNSCPVFEGNSNKGTWCIFTDIGGIHKTSSGAEPYQRLLSLISDDPQEIAFTADSNFVLTYIPNIRSKSMIPYANEISPPDLEKLLGKSEFSKIKKTMIDDLKSAEKVEQDKALLRNFINEIHDSSSGLIRWIETRIALTYDESGKPEGFIGVSHDITDKKTRDESLYALKSRQSYLLGNILDVLVCYNNDALITYVSPNIKQITGYDPSDIIGKPAGTFIHPDMKNQFEENLSNLQTTKGGGVFEYQLINKDGTPHWFRITSKPNINEKGELIEIVAVMANIDNYKELENVFVSTEKKENLYKHIVGKVHDLVWASTLDFLTMYVSPSVKTTLGYSVDEALGMEFGTTYKAESLNKVVLLFRQAQEAVDRGDLNWTGEISVNQYKRNRRALKGNMRLSILCDGKNNPYGYLGITSFRKRGPNIKQKAGSVSTGKRRGRPKGSRNSS